MAALKVQLALQGGGAKLVALVSAMQAVEQLQAENLIAVTRVSGTSAGALVAVLFAAGVPMGEVITYLEGLEHKKLFQRSRMRPKVMDLLAGQALFEGEALIKLHLERLLQKGRRFIRGEGVPVSFGELEIPAVVAVSDIQSHKLIQRKDADNIVHSVIDSSAFPFVLKAAKSSRNACLVDGGVCANLPTDLLSPASAADGPVVAVSFRPATSNSPSGLLSYAIALLETSIDNWVDQAKQRLGKASVHEIVTSIQTLEFEKAVGEGLAGLRAELGAVRGQAVKFFKGFVEETERREAERSGQLLELIGDPWKVAMSGQEWWAASIRAAMTGVFRMHEATLAASKIKYLSVTMEVSANSLLALDAGAPGVDEWNYRAEYEVAEGTLISLASAIEEAETSTNLQKSKLELLDARKQPISVHSLPALNAERPHLRYLVSCFDQPLKSGERFTRKIRDSVSGMFGKLIAEAGLPENSRVREFSDSLFIQADRAVEPVGKAVIVVFLPRLRGWELSLRADPKQRSEEARGKPMSDEELSAFENATPPGYVAAGWIWRSCAGPRFEVKLLAVRR